MSTTKQLFPQLVAKNIFGLRTNVVGNVHFSAEKDVIYPVEGVMVIEDYVTRKQKFFRMTENFDPVYMIMSQNRELIVVIEKDVEGNMQISAYNLVTYKKFLVIPLPELNSKRIRHICFSNDSKYLYILTKPPEQYIYMVELEKKYAITEFHGTLPLLDNHNYRIACHPSDGDSMVTAGEGVYTFLRKNEKGNFSVTQAFECKFFITSIAYLTNEIILMGTHKNQLLVVDFNNIKFVYGASSFEILNLELDREPDVKDVITEIVSLFDYNVNNLTCFSKGFAYVICNYVFVFEKIVDLVYERKTIIEIPITIYPEKLYQITNMTIDSDEEVVLVTTKHSQIYAAVLIVPEALKTKHLKFSPLGELIHIDEIIDISLCSWKPIIMTASKDRTIRIWNYENISLELVHIYPVDITAVALTATGLIAAIGFPIELLVCQIFFDELKTVKSYPFPACKNIIYSNLDHLMAASHENVLELCSTNDLEIMHSLKGHSSDIVHVIFHQNDGFVFSTSIDGIIIQWNVLTGEKITQISYMGMEFTSIAVAATIQPLILYAGTTDGAICVFKDGIFQYDISLPTKQKCELSAMCLARSDLLFFVATNIGNLYSVNMPLDKFEMSRCFDPYQFFVSGITTLNFTCDGQKLVATSSSGTLGIWKIKNATGRIAPVDRDLLKSNEILISRQILEEKNNNIQSLEITLKKQADQYQQIMEQNQISDGQQLAEVHKSYCEGMREFKEATKIFTERSKEHLANVYEQINEMSENFQKGLEQLSHQYSERMLIEFEKFNKLRNTMLELRKTYENQIKTSGFILEDSIEDLQADFVKKMDERRDLIINLMKEIDQNKQEFMEYCAAAQEENDHDMIMNRIEYEKSIKKQTDCKKIWHDRSIELENKYQENCSKLQYLEFELNDMNEELAKTMQQIDKANGHVENLRKDIHDRDTAIAIKEKRITELLYKNKELEKYKNVLQHKTHAIKETIKPRLDAIVDKSKHIAELETELEGLRTNNITLNLQLRELRDKYLSKKAQLSLETYRLKGCQRCTQDICQEIYSIRDLQTHNDLVNAIKNIFFKHSSDDELRKYLSSDPALFDYYVGQRANMERILKICRKNIKAKIFESTHEKYLRQNKFLRRELLKLKEENEILTKHQKKITTGHHDTQNSTN